MPDGTVVQWAVEGGAPSALLRRGWTRETLPPGTKVTVQGFMSKDGALRANARDITFPDGQQLFFSHVHLHGGPAPVRQYLPKLIDLVFHGTINPGKVFDLVLPLAQVAEGYRAMDERRAIKTLLQA